MIVSYRWLLPLLSPGIASGRSLAVPTEVIRSNTDDKAKVVTRVGRPGF